MRWPGHLCGSTASITTTGERARARLYFHTQIDFSPSNYFELFRLTAPVMGWGRSSTCMKDRRVLDSAEMTTRRCASLLFYLLTITILYLNGAVYLVLCYQVLSLHLLRTKDTSTYACDVSACMVYRVSMSV